MKNLHGIEIAEVQAWVWTLIEGGNGGTLGRVNGRAVYHLMTMQRGTPPAIQNEIGYTYYTDRRYWYPWNNTYTAETIEQKVTPMCGRIKTASRLPNLRAGHESYARNCPNCTQIAEQTQTTTHFVEPLVRNDPWTTIPRHIRNTTIDPVSGL